MAVSATGPTSGGEFARLVLLILCEQFLGRVLKHRDKLIPNNFSFLLGIGHAFKRGQETLSRIDIFQTNMKIFTEDALNNFFLTRAQEAIVHKNARELVADRFVKQRGRDGRIDATT